MEKRKAKVIFTTSGSGSRTTRVAIPVTWIDKLQITKDNRNLEIELNEEEGTIIIKKEVE